MLFYLRRHVTPSASTNANVLCVQATLEEVREADLLLHVLDASSPDVHHQRASVLQVPHSLSTFACVVSL